MSPLKLKITSINKCENIEKKEMGGACSTYGEKRSIYWVLVGNPEGKTPVRSPRLRWEDNINVNLQEAGCGVDCASSG
jgi:hypothetical protein